MRLAPVPLFFFPDAAKAVDFAAASARTTHGAPECLAACRLLASVLVRALEGRPKKALLPGDSTAYAATPAIAELAGGAFLTKNQDEIRGSGYVVESLEAALWCFFRTDTFEAAILAATNLGGDADTTAAVCGQVAGAHYGVSGIPSSWLARLARRDEITALADRLQST